MDQSDIPGRDDDVPMPDEISVVDPGHPLYGRRFRLHTITNAMRTCGYAFVEYRPGILLKLPITVTSLRLSPELRPAATKLSVEGLRELVALAGESEGACPSSQPKSGPTCQPPSAGRLPMNSPQSSGR